MFDISIKTKSYFVIILMIGCFALLYPKILHPMLMHLLGIRQVDKMQNDFIHPRDRHVKINPDASKSAFSGHSAHPGRMHAEKHVQGPRGGVMTMVLPVYAIGIIFYLIYTLVKVFGGSKNNTKREKRDSLLKNYYSDFHYDPNIGDFKMKYDEKDDDLINHLAKDSSYRFRPTNDIYDCTKTLPHDLEVLLQKVDDRNINEDEMRQLRIRLEQTEAQLTRILTAMEQLDVESKVDNQTVSDEVENIEKIASEEFEDCSENLDESNGPSDSELVHRRPVSVSKES